MKESRLQNHKIATTTLIDTLVADLQPVQPFQVSKHVKHWLLGTFIFLIAYVFVVKGIRDDLVLQLLQPTFWLTMFIAGCTVITAVLHTMMIAIPGYISKVRYTAPIFLSVLIAVLGHGLLVNFIEYPQGFLFFYNDWSIAIETLVLGTVPFLLLRYYVVSLLPTQPVVTTFWCAVASYTAAATMMRFHYDRMWGPIDDYCSIVVWVYLPVIFACLCITAVAAIVPKIFSARLCVQIFSSSYNKQHIQ